MFYRKTLERLRVWAKSGAIGKLRSLQQFIDQSECDIAVRFWSGKKSVETVKSISGKQFRLLNLPFYLISRIDQEI